MTKIVVVGGGAGGLIFANTLAKEMAPEVKSGALDIKIFDGLPYNEFQPGYLAVAFRGRDPESLRRRTETLVREGVQLIPEFCSKVDIANKYVETKKSGKRFDFDRIVIATGSSPDYSTIPGLREANQDYHSSARESASIYKTISNVKSGRMVTGIAGLPYKCPPSPNESAFMLDEFFYRRKLRKDVKITFVTPFLRAYSSETVNEVIEPMFRDRDIEMVTGFNLDSVDPEARTLESMEGDSQKYDRLMLVPPHSGVRVFKGTDYADEDGWIFTDKKDLHIKDYDYAFAVGDATNIPISKAGVEAHLESIVVAKNIVSEMRGNSERYEFTGRLQCSMETGFHQATFVIGTYEKPIRKIQPSFKNYLEKKFMEKVYWSSLQGGFEWLFKWHFGEDYYREVEPAQSPVSKAK